MFLIVLLCLAFAAAALWSVLQQPVTGHPRRNRAASGVLLGLSMCGIAVIVLYASTRV